MSASVERTIVLAAILTGCAVPSVEQALPNGAGSTSCGDCHETHFDDFAFSPHARSADSPILQAMIVRVQQAWGQNAAERCVACHAPEHAPDPGIGCTSCHAAVGNHAERDGELAIDLSAPLSGTLPDPVRTDAHRSRRRGFLLTDGLCGTCHELTGPNLVFEPTLTEFRASPQGAAGQTCTDCHMTPDSIASLTAETPPRPRHSHRFVGFDPPWGAAEGESSRRATESRELVASALVLRAAFVDDEHLEIEIENVGAAHNVPTGAAFLRDIWVDVERRGEVVVPRVLSLGDQPRLGDANVALLTEADRVETRSLPAGQTRSVTLDLARDQVRVVLKARAIRAEVLSALGLSERGVEVPLHRVHEVQP